MWQLDPDNGFAPVNECGLEGMGELKSEVRTLRPERFGGESDGDTVNLVAIDRSDPHAWQQPAPRKLWHARFDLPA